MDVLWDLKFAESERDCFVGERQTQHNANSCASASNLISTVLRVPDSEPTSLTTWHLPEEPEYSSELSNSNEYVYPEIETFQTNDRRSATSVSDEFMVLDWSNEHFAADFDRDAERLCKSLDADSTTGAHSPGTLRRQQLSASSMDTRTDELTSFPPIRLKSGASAGELGYDIPSSDITAEALKTKLLSAWTNIRNGWVVKTKTNFKNEFPICLLGQTYNCSKDDQPRNDRIPRVAYDLNVDLSSAFESFKLDFKSRIWLTYRSEFPVLSGSQLTSDVGWGCMIRCGQMLLAQALLVHRHSREWRRKMPILPTRREIATHRDILRLFGDYPDRRCPFSIHKLISIGQQEFNKMPGDWYGPASVSSVIREALKQSELGKTLAMYVSSDGTVYIDDVLDLCSSRESQDEAASYNLQPVNGAAASGVVSSTSASASTVWKSCIILIPVRLGGDVINPIYTQSIQLLLSHDLCIGIIGGRPKHSLYFIGYHDDKLLYLDPHCCQETVNVLTDDFPIDSYHCGSPRKLTCAKMDPSCSIGFYCRTRRDFDRLVKQAKTISCPPKLPAYSMFSFQPGRRREVELWTDAHNLAEDSSRLRGPRRFSDRADDFTLL